MLDPTPVTVPDLARAVPVVAPGPGWPVLATALAAAEVMAWLSIAGA